MQNKRSVQDAFGSSSIVGQPSQNPIPESEKPFKFEAPTAAIPAFFNFKSLENRRLVHQNSQQKNCDIPGTEVGRLSIDASLPNKYSWNIDNFSALTEQGELPFVSPPFFFLDIKWYLLMYHIKQHSLLSGRTGICLMQTLEERSKMNDQVHWKLSINRPDGTLFKSTEGCRRLDFYKSCDALLFGINEIEKEVLAPNESLTVICKLRLHGYETSTEASSQTDLTFGTDTLAQDLKELLLKGDASDATVRVKGQDFQVHRAILGARTPVFLSMFKHEMTEKATGIVNIEDCEPDTFRRFLYYVYSGRVEHLSAESATSLYEVADKYQMDELKADCLESIKNDLSIESFCETVTLAHKHNEIALLNLATEFFASNIKEIIVTLEWQNFMRKHSTQANELLIKALGAAK